MDKDIKQHDLSDSKYYFNRELSLIEFNRRVLLEGANSKHPLLERLKFLTILSSNLDEFFMIRVAGLKSQVAAGINYLSYDGKTAEQQLLEIRKQLLPIYKLQEDILIKEILPELSKHGIHVLRSENLMKKDKEYFKDYFFDSIFPLLTPLILSASHPFPRLVNRSLNIAFIIKDPEKKNEETSLAFLQIPMNLPRFLKLESRPDENYVLIESIIKEFAENLFPGLIIEQANTFRITRDADIEIAEDEAEDLISEIEEQIKLRRWGKDPVRLEVNHKMPAHLLKLLSDVLDLEKDDIYIVNRPLNLPDFMSLMKIDHPKLKDESFKPITNLGFQVENSNLFDEIKKQDILVHHPFDSFVSSTVKFVEAAALDSSVYAIKITLYRTGGDSLIIKALQKAAELGKNVTAFVELKARFDEENNIIWARELEQSGVHVIYGVSGLKTHSKIAMVVRNENNKLKTYLHISTGNYNQGTAKLYTDVALFTAKDSFAKEAVTLFNYLTGISHFKDWKEFHVAPINLRQEIIKMINREADKSTKENPGEIIAKMNALAHKEVIQALYKASQKGVKIKLLVRGVCCLKPGIKGISENIEVRSIIGRFLEHSRIFYFKNNGNEEYYISSADWMTRNLHQRVELEIPIYEKRNTKKLKEILESYWSDNTNSWRLLESGEYEKISPKDGEKQFSAQDFFLKKTHKQRQKNN
ncbi:MAG: polyphosphate kinase 1 [Candidatus Kapabacteria bacterium]|nr:polyphosphate kinase 1 [Candidatus Kapabacteria bacterium]